MNFWVSMPWCCFRFLVCFLSSGKRFETSFSSLPYNYTMTMIHDNARRNWRKWHTSIRWYHVDTDSGGAKNVLQNFYRCTTPSICVTSPKSFVAQGTSTIQPWEKDSGDNQCRASEMVSRWETMADLKHTININNSLWFDGTIPGETIMDKHVFIPSFLSKFVVQQLFEWWNT